MSADLATREFNERLEAHDSSLLELIPARLATWRGIGLLHVP